FHRQCIAFLGYVIDSHGVHMDQDKVHAVTNWPQPHTIKELQCFLGFANFYRRFIRNFSSIASSLISLLNGSVCTLSWSASATDAFHCLKMLFITAPVLKHPDSSLPFVIEVDASESGVGTVLSQCHGQPPKLYPCSFFSKKFSLTEMEPLPIPQRPWSHITIDFITDLPNSNGYSKILVAVDRFSKSCRLLPLKGLPSALEKVLMKLRKPRITASIWSSGKIICTGATSEEEAKIGARRLARCLQKLGFKVKFTEFKVVNVLAVCTMPFEIRLPEFTKKNRPIASYEPELHPAASYRIKNLKATLQIFSTGSVTVTGNVLSIVGTYLCWD
ncbi:TBPL1 protein, partial [Amia calva]|nr:TBPL1 protein [Amia calva]